jgi:hypothetical protein
VKVGACPDDRLCVRADHLLLWGGSGGLAVCGERCGGADAATPRPVELLVELQPVEALAAENGRLRAEAAKTSGNSSAAVA